MKAPSAAVNEPSAAVKALRAAVNAPRAGAPAQLGENGLPSRKMRGSLVSL